jgi:hypothetical protein
VIFIIAIIIAKREGPKDRSGGSVEANAEKILVEEGSDDAG